MTPPWLDEALSLALRLTLWQQFGLAFLLGSFTVATLSDLKRLSAQREFLEVWLLFVLAVLAFDAWRAHDGRASAPVFFLKWGLILGLSLLSLKRVGERFGLRLGCQCLAHRGEGFVAQVGVGITELLSKLVLSASQHVACFLLRMRLRELGLRLLQQLVELTGLVRSELT